MTNTIDQKLASLASLMADMAENDMGNLHIAEAALFHTACNAIDNLIEARNGAKEYELDDDDI